MTWPREVKRNGVTSKEIHSYQLLSITPSFLEPECGWPFAVIELASVRDITATSLMSKTIDLKVQFRSLMATTLWHDIASVAGEDFACSVHRIHVSPNPDGSLRPTTLFPSSTLPHIHALQQHLAFDRCSFYCFAYSAFWSQSRCDPSPLRLSVYWISSAIL